MISNEEYIEFDLKALFFYILRQWKTVVFLGLVFALLLGSIQTLAARPADVPEDAGIVYTEEYERYLEKRDRLTQRIAYSQYCVDNFEEYIQNSARMQIDYQNANTAKATYYIDFDYTGVPENMPQAPDKTNTLAWLYNDSLSSRTVYEEIAAAVGMDVKYVPELITVANPNAAALTISVSHPSQQTTQDIMDILQDNLQTIHVQLKETVGEHTLTCTADTFGVYFDQELHLSQNATQNHLINLQTLLSTYKYELRDLEEPALPQKTSPAAAEKNMAEAFVLWAVIGGIVGVILAVAFIFAKSVLRNRLHASSQLVSSFRVTVLGEVVCSRNRLSPFSRKLNRLEGCISENSDNNYQLLAENIRNHCHNTGSILICSDTGADISSRLAAELGKYLPGLSLLPAGDPLKEASALRTLSECDAVVIIAQRDHSRNADIKKMLTQIQSYGKNLIGFIVAY